MFSFKYAFFAAGLLAGWSFDKKNNIPIIGIFTYLFVVNAFSLVFNYDYSWAFLAFIEMLAGHGLYKMGFGNFLGELFSSSELKKETNKVITASKAAKTAYISRKTTRTVVSSKPLPKDFGITKKDVESFNENISKLKKYSFYGSLVLILIAPFPQPVLAQTLGTGLILTIFLMGFLYPLSFLFLKYMSTKNNSNYDKCNKYTEKLEKYEE